MKLEVSSDFVIHSDSNEIEFHHGSDSKRIKIEPIAMDLLKYLVDNRGMVCSTEELVENLWDGNEPVGKPALRKNIYKLRMAIKSGTENDLIKTIPKKGYSFSDENIVERSKARYSWRKLLIVLTAIIILITAIKIIYPGIFHWLLHRLSH